MYCIVAVPQNQFSSTSLPQIREAVVMATTAVQASAEDNFSTSVTVESPVESQNQETENNDVDIASEFVTLRQPGPPPYHVAAMYSKNAQYFSNINKQDDGEKNDPPRYFVQDQPRDILMPQAQHGQLPSTVLNEIQRSITNGSVSEDEGQLKGRKWMFGQHKNRRVMEFSLTPCCYVPGFSVSLGQTVRRLLFVYIQCFTVLHSKGVYVDEVYEDGNAYMKLEPGDKILHIDDVDITEMDPEQAAKIVVMRAPEADSIVISRNT